MNILDLKFYTYTKIFLKTAIIKYNGNIKWFKIQKLLLTLIALEYVVHRAKNMNFIVYIYYTQLNCF